MKTITVSQEHYTELNLGSFGSAGPYLCISGMKAKYWGKDALCVKCGVYVYKVDEETYEKAKSLQGGKR